MLFGLGQTQIAPDEELGNRLSEWTSSSVARFENLVSQTLKVENPGRYSRGTWYVSCAIVGESNPLSLGELLGILREIQGHETGWPLWWVPTLSTLAPYPQDGNIECWMRQSFASDSGHSDFWKVSPKGFAFLLRGYREDGNESPSPGAFLDLTLPIWRIAECLLHAERFATRLASPKSKIIFRAKWTGLNDRNLLAWAGRNRGFTFTQTRTSHQDSVESELIVEVERISLALPELVSKFTQPLYEIFNFYKPSIELINQELNEMKVRNRKHK